MSRKSRGKVEEAAPKSPFVIVLVVAAILGVGVVAYAMTSKVAERDMAIAPVEVAGLDNPQTLLQMAQPGMVVGDANAPITIMEFADYSCPHCREFKEIVIPRIDLTYIKTGVAKLVFHDLVLGSFPHSFLAARAARCAGDQNKYFEYNDILFDNQPTWSTRPTSPSGLFEDYAKQIGLDTGAFEGCLRSNKYADVVTANRRMADELNLSSTPSILVRAAGLPTQPEPDFESISKAVEAAKGSAGAPPAP